MHSQKLIIVAGATGDLGHRICRYLIQEGATVRALTRSGGNKESVTPLTRMGVDVIETDYSDPVLLADACKGAFCVVSALSGLREVIVDTQSLLLSAAVKSGVVKFIPSDYCTDYRNLPHGRNRNLDFRKEFATILSDAPISATSILNGMFSDLLLGQAPVILTGMKRIFFWGNADQKMDFTTIDNTAQFTAKASLDATAPRWLMIAGDVASMRDMKNIATEVTKEPYKFLRPGSLRAFSVMIKLTRMFSPGKNETFPAWQGMQYLYDMLSGVTKFPSLDNDRYKIRWTPIREVIEKI